MKWSKWLFWFCPAPCWFTCYRSLAACASWSSLSDWFICFHIFKGSGPTLSLCFNPVHPLLEASGQLTSCFWGHRGLSGGSEETELFLLLLPLCGTICLSTLGRPLRCWFLKLVLKPNFMHEDPICCSVFTCFLCGVFFFFYLVLLFGFMLLSFYVLCFMMYSTLFQLGLHLKGFVNEVDLIWLVLICSFLCFKTDGNVLSLPPTCLWIHIDSALLAYKLE